jgi:hypothetical protein
MRKTAPVTIPAVAAFGRDIGKKFLLTEMPASQAEEWAVRALSAASKGGVDVPESMIAAGWSAVAFAGMRAVLGAPWPEVKPLLDEMMTCVKSIQEAAPDGRPLVEDDIEEIATRAFLRDEVFRLHANFSVAETISRVISTLQAVPGDTQDMPTSPDQSEPSSVDATQPLSN